MSWKRSHVLLGALMATLLLAAVSGCVGSKAEADKVATPPEKAPAAAAPIEKTETPATEVISEVSPADYPPIATLPADLPKAEFLPGYLIETEEFAEILGQPNLVILDGRLAADYQKAHIPGAINLRWPDVRNYESIVNTGLHLTPEMAEEVFGNAGIDENTRVIVYDDGAGRGANGLAFVLWLFSHENAQMLNGGFRKWVEEGRPVTDEIPTVEKKTFTATPRDDMTVTLDWLVKNKDMEDVLIVDPRDFGEYVGIDTLAAWPANARPGHIAGAVSFVWTDAGGELETFRSPEEIQYLLLEEGITKDKTIITYCNPGIGRSTYLYMLLKMLGYEKVYVYSGSYEEWSNHKELPVGVIQ